MRSLILFLFCFANISFSQTTISGKVTSQNGEPLFSANVFLKDTYDGTSTDEKGNYSFTTIETGEQILVVSYIGFKSEEKSITLNGENIVVDFVLEEEASELDQVVISAGSFEASDEKKSVILRPLDIVTTAGAEADVYGVLQTLPGTQTIGETEGLFVRGGSAAESKTMIDGMIVQNPYYSSVPDLPSRGRFSPFIFKGTIFSTGGYSAQYGQALSSALILKSQDLASDTRSSINLMAVGIGGAHTQRWENTSLSGEISYYDLKPYFEIQKQRTDWIRAPRGIEGNIVFRQKTSQTGILKLFSSYSSGDLSLNVDNLDNPDVKDPFQLEDNNFYLNTSFDEIFGEDWTFFTGVSYSKDINDLNLAGDLIDTDEQRTQSKMTISKGLFGNSFITFGGEVHNIKIDESFNEFNRNLNNTYYAGYAETDIFITNDFAARIGLRVEKVNIIDKTNLAPRTALAYRVGTFSTINFAYGHFYQIPENEFLHGNRGLNFE
ncbi:MAG: TonB-dependent receptor, partial [Ignavibacteria bacterium]|nr:TonB-dependent receptor [Ignavibacteria bacterium]